MHINKKDVSKAHLTTYRKKVKKIDLKNYDNTKKTKHGCI